MIFFGQTQTSGQLDGLGHRGGLDGPLVMTCQKYVTAQLCSPQGFEGWMLSKVYTYASLLSPAWIFGLRESVFQGFVEFRVFRHTLKSLSQVHVTNADSLLRVLRNDLFDLLAVFHATTVKQSVQDFS